MSGLALERLSGTYAICRLEADAHVPEWAAPQPGSADGSLLSITRTERELSIVAPQDRVPRDVQANRGWRAFRLRGTLDFSLVGVLNQLTAALAAAEAPVFAISTYDTDIVLVQKKDLGKAETALARWLGEKD